MLRVNGFYGHIKQHDLRSVGMFLGFMVAFQIVAAVLMTVPMLFIDVHKIPIIAPTAYFKSWGIPVFVVGLIFFLFRYAAHLKDLQASLGFETVDRFAEPRLFSVVEPVAITAGIKMPEVAVLESDAFNAFACGLSEDTATVVVTRGLMNALDDEELEAVIAHEITHIKNGDIALLAVANTALSSIKWLEKWNLLKFGKKRSIFLIFMPVLIFLMMFINFVMNVGTTIAKVSRLLIASSREYVADAEAVRLTHNPSALISALQKIDGKSAIEGLDEVADAMMIDGAVEGAFATHPTIAERIAVLSQHAGAMVHGNTIRRDTRASVKPAFGQIQPQNWFKPTPAPAKPAASRSLIERVNSDRKTNMFGINLKAAKYMKIGMFLFFGLSTLGSMAMQSRMSQITKQIESSSIDNKIGSAPNTKQASKPENKTVQRRKEDTAPNKVSSLVKKVDRKPQAKSLFDDSALRGTSSQ
ncbi:MAG: M48 family metalloprotease [Salaquimonas sp.]